MARVRAAKGQAASPLDRAAVRRGTGLLEAASGPLTILDMIRQDFPRFLAPSWAAWLVWLRALFALEPEPGDLEVYQQHTGRQDWPARALREAWAILGRRGGKSVIAALIAVYLACYCDYRGSLAPGERAVLAVIAADRHQAQVIFRYVVGLLESVPALKRLIARKTREAIELRNGVTIEIHTSSFRSTRGFTLCGVVADESSFWWTDETSANPDVEVLAALRPGLMTLQGPLISVTTPYARKGAAWTAYRTAYGVAGAPVLVWGGDSRSMNPELPEADIAAAYEADPQAASAEYGGEFRSDLEAFISEELLARVVVPGRASIEPASETRYYAFCDPSGGSQDSFTLAIAHGRGETAVLDFVAEVAPPFSPEQVVADFAREGLRFRAREVTGDAYAGEWPREQFRKHGIEYRVSEMTKSEIYLAALPMLTSGKVELLEHTRLLAQLRGLERRTGRSGRDSVDHGPRGRDDLANAACGALTLVQRAARGFDSTATAWPKSHAPQHAAGPDLDDRGTRAVNAFAGVFETASGERFRDARGLGPEEPSERCPRCTTEYPRSFRAQHLQTSPKCRPPSEFDSLRREGWEIRVDPLNALRVYYKHNCGANGNVLRASLAERSARHMRERHAS